VDRTARVPQALARPAGAHGDYLGEDRDRRLRRRAGTDVEAAWGVDPGDRLLIETGVAQALGASLLRAAAPTRSRSRRRSASSAGSRRPGCTRPDRSPHLPSGAVAADARNPLVELPARVAHDRAIEQLADPEAADDAVLEDRHRRRLHNQVRPGPSTSGDGGDARDPRRRDPLRGRDGGPGGSRPSCVRGNGPDDYVCVQCGKSSRNRCTPSR
jgi:hypothetical protein